mmetsp:Transcript_68518/g.178025  ORF Transcript_68518/g.178025 Transcript_68518/m.178025 type:complete len:215 (+) Transcript_68518:396-1040(+)
MISCGVLLHSTLATAPPPPPPPPPPLPPPLALPRVPVAEEAVVEVTAAPSFFFIASPRDWPAQQSSTGCAAARWLLDGIRSGKELSGGPPPPSMPPSQSSPPPPPRPCGAAPGPRLPPGLLLCLPMSKAIAAPPPQPPPPRHARLGCGVQKPEAGPARAAAEGLGSDLLFTEEGGSPVVGVAAAENVGAACVSPPRCIKWSPIRSEAAIRADIA